MTVFHADGYTLDWTIIFRMDSSVKNFTNITTDTNFCYYARRRCPIELKLFAFRVGEDVEIFRFDKLTMGSNGRKGLEDGHLEGRINNLQESLYTYKWNRNNIQV